MAKQTINIGSAPNSGNGDVIRVAFTKVNDNFTELYARSVFSGSYNDLTNKPALFSGSYNDLTNKPTIPTDISQLTDTTNLLGDGGNANTGNIQFRNDTMSSLTGVIITNADQTTAGTASITIPANGAASAISIANNNNIWSFSDNGETTLPGRLNFPDGSSYGDNILTSAVDSDLGLEVKHITTVSAEAFHGGVDDLIFNISENDDITVVQPGWELNVGSELAPLWVPVAQASIDQSGNYEIRFSEDYNFEDFTTYTFRNPVPESKTWFIRNQTGGLVGPGGVIFTNETYPLGEGTYRELAIELPSNDDWNEQRLVFSNDGRLKLPQYHQIESVGSNATISLNGVGSNESIIELATRVDNEMITSTFDMHPAFGIALNSVRRVDITAGYDSATLKYNTWFEAEAMWAEVRDQDAQLIAPNTRPWAGMPSYEAYTEIMLYSTPPGVLPPPGNMAPIANAAKTAYLIWQEEQAAINVTVSAIDKTWTFGNNGDLRLPAGGDIVDSTGNSVLGETRVKLQSPGDRRIEEVYGYKEVSVTALTPDAVFTGVTLSPTLGPVWDVFIDGIVHTDLFNYVTSNNYARMTLSINGSSYEVDAYISESNVVLFNTSGTSVNYNEGDAFTVTKFVGGESVVWWDRNELPGGGTDFRGATIDYHAFTGESTIIGTIHIVRDSGEEHISHTEVQSGSTDGENDDLWLVTTEGQIRYRRIDKEEKTLKVQWSAKVFYGSEFWD